MKIESIKFTKKEQNFEFTIQLIKQTVYLVFVKSILKMKKAI